MRFHEPRQQTPAFEVDGAGTRARNGAMSSASPTARMRPPRTATATATAWANGWAG
ncbi:hypothetical protein AB0C36_32140 [Streptodolium elevatio]|uniref:Uncharacterized protein n=1 Tax=Streptodolium elevatio TaxID=3157996 RepID=A0ABV3DQW5_9ACTN